MKNFKTVFSAWDGEKLVGMVCAMDDGIMNAYVHYLLVNPEYHGRTIGRTLVGMMKEHYNDGELDYGFVWKETGELIGSGGLNYDEKSGNWKLGYNLRFDMWGRGIATEASRKVIEYTRAHYKGNKIIGTFALENPASRHVMEKLGMKFLRECEYSKFDGSETFKAQDWEMDF